MYNFWAGWYISLDLSSPTCSPYMRNKLAKSITKWADAHKAMWPLKPSRSAFLYEGPGMYCVHQNINIMPASLILYIGHGGHMVLAAAPLSCIMAHAYTACINIMPAGLILYIGHDDGMVLTIPHVRQFRPQHIHGLSWPWCCYHSYHLTRLHHPRPTRILNACSRTNVSCHGQDASCDWYYFQPSSAGSLANPRPCR